MKASESLPSAEALLRAAPPPALVAIARRLLAERAGAEEVTLLLADYDRAATGVPPAAHRPLVHLPISVRGDRMGVLSVRRPAGRVGPDTVLQLGDFATALGHEVATADRDTDLYVQARRTRRLTLAAEMQW
ncbi:hypothetical protein ABT187_37100 [Streptomyces sp. NPDC001817]|uniref:hypothetical protein n=1 Tax=Streptomyces sp. NPDC001817 TaxID=3154398 RepID=UPI00332E1501